ncbi:MAG: CBS domain-containing protein [Burkholderiales bacterium]|nr:CBS domain-containing protein [Burkholderiales bacterium]
MQIRDILGMKGGAIFSIAPDGRLADAVAIMVSNDIGSLVVMKDGAMAGMLTFREVLNELNARSGNLGDARVADVMLENPITGAPSDSVDRLREVMIENHIRYLPVTENAQLLGVVSFHDVAKAVIKQTNFENRLLKRYIKNWPEEEDNA